jgi:hypothetical protein
LITFKISIFVVVKLYRVELQPIDIQGSQKKSYLEAEQQPPALFEILLNKPFWVRDQA